MKLVRSLVAITIVAFTCIACSKGSNSTLQQNNNPAPGSKKTFTVDVTYYILDYSDAVGAKFMTFPVAVFSKDDKAKKYSVSFTASNQQVLMKGKSSPGYRAIFLRTPSSQKRL